MNESTVELELKDLGGVKETRPVDSSTTSNTSEEELLSCTDGNPETMDGQRKIQMKKELTVLSGVGFVVGGIIGSGIFITPKTILENTGSFGLSMVAWVIGALIAMAGSLCYVELGLLIRKSGGEYVYLLEAYSFNAKGHPLFTLLGSLLAFLYTWASVFIMRGASSAVLMLTFAHYLTKPFYIDEDIPEINLKLVGLCCISVITLINCYSVKLSARIMTAFTIFKILAVVVIAGIGLVEVLGSKGAPDSFYHPFTSVEGFKLSPSSLALGLYGVLWAFDGWSVLNYVVEETKNVERTLPLSLFIGIPIVTLCYLLVNFAFFSVLTYEEILSAEAVAIPFGVTTIGKGGLFIVPVLVALSVFSSSNGGMFSASRLIYASAKEGALPQMFSGIHTTFQTPVPALLLMSSIAAFFMVIGNIDVLIEGYAVTAYIFYLLTILALLIMRVTHPKQPRPFKGVFIVPVAILVALSIIFLIFLPLFKQPGPSLLALGATLLGIPIYLLLVMEKPWKLRPKFLDQISDWLTSTTNYLLNTQ